MLYEQSLIKAALVQQFHIVKLENVYLLCMTLCFT